MFITFEGGEGSGKSTQSKLLHDYLENVDIPVCLTRQPGGTQYGRKIREVIQNESGRELTEVMPDTAEVLLFMADRNIHVNNIIKPKLAEGRVVLCDRYIDSSVAYQGFGRGLGQEFVENLNNIAIEGVVPDLTLLFDIEPEVGLERVRTKNAENGGVEDRIEQADIEFHTKLREGYLTIAQQNSGRVVVIDASQTEESIFEQVKKEFKKK